jgi:Right handed beta helix region
MKSILNLKPMLLLLFLPGSLLAQDYYVCDRGSNKNSGKLASEPWATFDYAMTKFGSLKAGDAILFCRTGTFTSSFPRLFNPLCTAALPCTLADYVAPGTAAKSAPPVIQGNASGALNFQDGGKADADGGYVVKNLTLKGVGTGRGIFIFNDVDYLTVDNVLVDSFAVGIHSAGANTPSAGADWSNDNLTIKNSIISNNGGQGFHGMCNNCLIDNNKFTNNGFLKAVYNHNLYVSGDKSHDIVISNNTLTQSTMINGKCSGVSLVVHGVVNNLKIQGNTIIEDVGKVAQTCWGISVDPGYATEESFSKILISNNTVTNVGNVGIGCASCTDVRIVDNKISHAQDFGFAAIKLPVRAEDTVKSDNITITGNKIDLLDTNNKGKAGVTAPEKKAVRLEKNTITFSK